MTIPHRISLARAWTPLDHQPEVLNLQRFFQKPTNLCSQTTIRLRIDSQREFQSVHLNGEQLDRNSKPRVGNAKQVDTENSLEFGYDWDITENLKTRNQLVLCWPVPDPHPPESLPSFEVWLEIFAP